MTKVRENFIKVLQNLPYDINTEIFKRDTKDILRDVTQKYVETYGLCDLSDNDKDCIEALIGTKI